MLDKNDNVDDVHRRKQKALNRTHTQLFSPHVGDRGAASCVHAAILLLHNPRYMSYSMIQGQVIGLGLVVLCRSNRASANQILTLSVFRLTKGSRC